MLSLLYGPTLTSVHDYWKNRSFDYEDITLKEFFVVFGNFLLYLTVQNSLSTNSILRPLDFFPKLMSICSQLFSDEKQNQGLLTDFPSPPALTTVL